MRRCNSLHFAVGLALLLLGGLALPAHGAESWKPNGNVEFIAGSGPGSGLDVATRTVEKLLREKRLVDVSTTIVNKPGAGLAVSFTYLNQFAGNGHYLAITSPSLVLNKILGTHALTYTDVTPVAQLISENIAFAVNADSPLKTGQDLISRLKKDPGSVSIAVSTALGGANHLAGGMVMKKAGIDLKKAKFVAFKSGGEVKTALLGGHVDAIVISASVLVGPLQSGQVRVLGISSAKRAGDAFATVPTWKEQGVDAVFTNWRGMVLPRGATAAQVAHWEDVFAKLVKTPEWKSELSKKLWQDEFLGAEQSKRFLGNEATELKALLSDLGLLR